MNDNSSLFEEGSKGVVSLRCPICTEFPEAEVYQCKNGHSICKQCSKYLQQCPECRVPYIEGYVRNRALEDILQTVEVDCPKRAGGDGLGPGPGPGCEKKVKLKDVVRHLKTCSIAVSKPFEISSLASHKSIQLCKLLGYINCEFLVELNAADNTTRDLPNVRDHFVQKHLGVDRSGPGLKIKLMNFGLGIELCKGKDKDVAITWHPVLLNIDGTPEGRTFLVFAMIHPDDSKSLSWFNIFLGGGGHNHEGISSQSDLIVRLPGFHWKFPAIGLASTDFASILKVRPFRTPLDSLKHFMKPSGDSLQVDLEIVMAMGKPPKQMNTKVQDIQELLSLPINLNTNSSLPLASLSQFPKPDDSSFLGTAPQPEPSSSSMAVSESRSRPSSSLPPLPLPKQLVAVPAPRPPRGCANCRKYLRSGPQRYYCMQCKGDYLICEACYKDRNRGIHMNHVFLLVDSDVKMGISYTNNAFIQEPSPLVMPSVCDRANIPRCLHTSPENRVPLVSYVCVECVARPCRFCSGCMKTGRANEVHTGEHFLAVTDTRERAEFVEYLFYTGVLPKAVVVDDNPWL